MRWHGVSGPAKSGKGKKAGAAAAAARPQPVAFVGKGVTFDSGGISIKPAGGMEDMKWDMAGAGAVIGAMAALAGRQARVDAVGIVGLVENMRSRSSTPTPRAAWCWPTCSGTASRSSTRSSWSTSRR